ncbi:cation diffusion facilitator family transporter [Desulfosoma caldarium]|uniref:Cation diffusion facilitator family transporter n=1 Tax=Desulfosoma caldarium TaxID=610254 RepID=A0A3N1UYI8_9BACT|nr:cation diffusion facilitator family transporter [Desulfosoma caldarium]ROQ92356.1 cation diffusion facilitator family transporter [Desulfosoma caldarium]
MPFHPMGKHGKTVDDPAAQLRDPVHDVDDPLSREFPDVSGEDEAHGHGACEHHGHGLHAQDASGSRLLLTMLLNLLIPSAQVVGGVLANSVAVLSDATHNFGDFAALLIAYIAWRVGRRGATTRHTFGFRRVEILAALLNVLLLVGACSVILWEAVQRFRHPQEISGSWVMALAAVGVVGNGFSAWLLHRDAAHNLNMRGAFLHMMGDLLTSVAVLINGAVLLFKPWTWLDPLLSLIIVALILKNCWSVLQEAVAVLMNAAPRHVDISRVKETLEALPGVLNAHYLHAWHVSSSSIAFSCHLVIPDQKLSQGEQVRRQAAEALRRHFGIDHAIIQLETLCCGNGSLLCEGSCHGTTAMPSTESSRGEGRETRPAATSVPLHEGLSRKSQRFRQGALTVVRIALGLVFLYAAYEKILEPWDFAQTVDNYKLLPAWAVNAVALVLPWLEALVGVCLMAGLWLPGAFTTATGLLVVFLGSLVVNLLRGVDVDCGCFGTGEGVRNWSMRLSILRDAVLLGMAAVGTWLVMSASRSERLKPMQGIGEETARSRE